MSAPVLFLDIDGVLNGEGAYDEIAKSNRIWAPCVEQLNAVLLRTGCDVVVSSAWRYMILGQAMTLKGFEYLLQTHGVACTGHLIGYLGRDSQLEDPTERAQQVEAWLEANPWCVQFAIVDNMDMGFSRFPQFVQTCESTGLTSADAQQLIRMLGRRRGRGRA